MLKLLQEVRGFALFPAKPLESRPHTPLLLQFRTAARRKAAAKIRYTLRISMRQLPDIPQPVPITFLGGKSES